VATYGAGSWTSNRGVTERLAVFGRKVLRRIYGEIKLNEIWRKRSNAELM
jgi:hypothetical protein